MPSLVLLISTIRKSMYAFCLIELFTPTYTEVEAPQIGECKRRC